MSTCAFPTKILFVLVIQLSSILYADSTVFSEYIVSTNGLDSTGCGNWTNPCGTLYFASTLVEQSEIEQATLYVLDGQSETDIVQYHMNPYHPCFPPPLGSENITITFNPDTIKELNDWFPLNVCHDQIENEEYSNEYIFDSSQSISINHLIISNYTSYLFIRGDSISCTNCSFTNIVIETSTEDDRPAPPDGGDPPPRPGERRRLQGANDISSLFYSVSDVHFASTIFADIEASVLLYWNGDVYTEERIRNALIQDCTFTNIQLDVSVISIMWSRMDRFFGATLDINACLFSSVSTGVSVIDDGSRRCDVSISDSAIDIEQGAIFQSAHLFESHIDLNNMSIFVAADYTGDVDGLLYFAATDKVNITAMDILYWYDTESSCIERETLTNSVLNASCAVVECVTPPTAIYNNGQVQMEDISVDMDVSYVDNSTINGNHYTSFRYAYVNEGAPFIRNTAIMNITNMVIKESISLHLIFNDGSLSVSNLVYDVDRNADYDPNMLHSERIIYQSGLQPSLYVYDSHLVGSYYGIFISAGTAEITNSVIEQSSRALGVWWTESFTLHNCQIINSGQYNGQFISDYLAYKYMFQGVQVWYSNDISFVNNTISGFDPKGLFYIQDASNIQLTGNTLDLNADHLFYPISSNDEYLEYSPLVMWFNQDTKLIQNTFLKNEIQIDIPWVDYQANTGTNCLAGNTFHNYAFHAHDTDITSCLRPDLIRCIAFSDRSNCSQQMYGYIDESLFNLVSDFIIDTEFDIPSIFSANGSDIAMDHVNITTVNINNVMRRILTISSPLSPHVVTDPITVLIDEGNLLLVDSYITSHDISYESDICDVLYNDRLLNHTGYVARLWIDCFVSTTNTSDMAQSMDSEVTQLVSHLSATKIDFRATTTSYYPGQLLQFAYEITDSMNNDIVYNLSDAVITIAGDKFLAWIEIEDNACPVCETGILLNDISLKHSIGTVYTLDVFIKDSHFIALTPTISLNVTACPIGYGPESNNFTCIACNTDYYNLSPNNVRECVSCNPEQNIGVKCREGNMNLSHNYWLGFVEEQIVSNTCPTGYCCRQADGCSVINDDKNDSMLCAANREHGSTLCGQCKPGYSESMNSTQCVQCERHFYFEYLLLPVFLSLFLVLFLIATNRDRRPSAGINSPRAVHKVMALIRDPSFQLMMKIMIIKNIWYYEQSVSQIIAGSPSKIVCDAFASMFNLSITSIQSDADDEASLWCFIDGLNAKQKILVDLFVPCMMILFIFSFYLVSRYVIKKALAIRGGKINFGKAAVSTYLVIIGKILDVLFRLLSCQKVGGYTFHFYFAYEHCHGRTWFLSLMSLICVILSFTFVFIKLKRMSVDDRQNPNHILNIITSRYKPQHYYWELIIFIRRLVISVFAVSVHDVTAKFVLLIILFVFVFMQYTYAPFLVNEANHLEIILMSAFIIITMTQIIPDDLNVLFINICVSFCIMLPIPLLIYYVLRSLLATNVNVVDPREQPSVEEIKMETQTTLDGGENHDRYGTTTLDSHQLRAIVDHLDEIQAIDESGDDDDNAEAHTKQLTLDTIQMSTITSVSAE
eukprot:303163_1